MSARPTAFVLSGGASLGAMQAGMLRALFEQGIAADLLVGTSAGALNAAFVASRPQTPATARDLARVWRDLHRDDVFPVSMRALVGGLSGKRDHLVPDHALRRLIGRYVEFEELADAATPVHVVAYDVSAGEEVLLSEGSAVDAIVASASIPGVFPPLAVGDRRLVDGGVINNTPISHAVGLGAERVYVLPTRASPHRIDRPPGAALDAAIRALALLVEARFTADLARYADDVELIVLPAPNSARVQPTDFDHASRLTAEALDACRQLLARQPVSATNDEHHKVRALNAGADDFVTKPFAPRELIARVRATMRRAQRSTVDDRIEVEGLALNIARRAVYRDGEEIHLTPIEFKLLGAFLGDRGRLLTHESLLRQVWGPRPEHDTATLRPHIANLRRKIPRSQIRTVHGVGYRFEEAQPRDEVIPGMEAPPERASTLRAA